MSRRYWVFLLLFLLCLEAFCFSAGLVEAGGSSGLRVALRVGVLVFDPEHRLLQGVANNSVVERSINCNSYSIVLEARITYFYASLQATVSLKDWLKNHYRDYGVPFWARSYVYAHNLSVKWVPLRGFYEYLWNLTREEWMHRGVNFSDTVVVIGDLDGVSRQYYESPPPIVSVERIEGVKGWAGNKPLVFYDLSVVAKPWPEEDIPFYGEGRSVSIESEPPIWSLSNPGSYIEGLARDHFLYHYASFCTRRSWYADLLRIKVVLVDYGNENTTRALLSTLNTSLIEDLVEAMDPWIRVGVEVELVNVSQAPWFRELLNKSKLEGGWLVLDFNSVVKAVKRDIAERFGSIVSCSSLERGGVCGYVFYVLATPIRSFMRFSGSMFNFTGFSYQYYGATSFPGYGYRVLKGNLNRVVAHEAGHYLGLGHPFQLEEKGRISTRWLMDMVESVMSYYNPSLAFYRSSDLFYYDAYKTGLIHLPALLEQEPWASSVVEEALGRGDVFGALRVLLRSRSSGGVCNCSNTTVATISTFTTTATITSTVTSIVTKTFVVTSTKLESTTVTKTVTETVTVSKGYLGCFETSIMSREESSVSGTGSTLVSPGCCSVARGGASAKTETVTVTTTRVVASPIAVPASREEWVLATTIVVLTAGVAGVYAWLRLRK